MKNKVCNVVSETPTMNKWNDLVEKSKGLVEEFMTYTPYERKSIMSLLWGIDPEVVVSVSLDKCGCIDSYLGDLSSMEYEEIFYEDCDFEEDKFEEVRDFLMGEEYNLIWSILELDEIDSYDFLNVEQHMIDEGSREEFFQYELGELIQGVYNHPDYKSYSRDKKLEGLGL
ncbi:hypothetical protein UFOVP163_26 [uncultured Caudovirales phage]|uniref:Uncharacterized protein n=1 Tax=uncultured Caudovirales phage TaxID=2100421 RepID=A0A6J7WH42_9CAUD|nr:hypothetical protein UFOVP163_26 [uncultured Caudovirales phage]